MPARSRPRVTSRGRSASCGISSSTCRSRRSAAPRCVGDGDIPKDRSLDAQDIPSTYVPARNTVFLSLAMAWAEVVGAEAIVIGVNALDYSGYPDCRPEYLHAFERLARLATRAGVEGRSLRVLAPLLQLSKADIIRRGLALGVDYGLTHSCYDPGAGRTPVRPLRQLRAARPGLQRGGHCRSRGEAEPRVTERLYYTDPYLREFDAAIVERTAHDGRPAVVLDRTAFYPTSGGQPFDIGTLGGVRVVDVVDTDDGRILHVVDRVPEAPPFTERSIGRGASITCSSTPASTCCRPRSIACWARGPRASIWAPTTRRSIWRARLSAADVARAEDEANRVVWEDRPVTIRFAGRRRRPRRCRCGRSPSVRARCASIDVQDFDLSACGGTHVSRTGAIGIIAVSATERFRGGTRVTFLCGGRA